MLGLPSLAPLGLRCHNAFCHIDPLGTRASGALQAAACGVQRPSSVVAPVLGSIPFSTLMRAEG